MASTVQTGNVEGAGESPIRKFMAGKSFFITGSTGFIGKLLVEKLLRSCGDLKKIYVLVRPKKGLKENERISKEFGKLVFEQLAKSQPNFMTKIHLIHGDLTQPNLGMSPADVELLKNEADGIFHVAATTNFTQNLRIATRINVRATEDLLNIAKEMKNLKFVVHVSTAFAHCTRKTISEEVHQTRLSAKKLVAVVDALSDELLDAITPQILGDSPNTYVFTKAVNEDLILNASKSVPVAIVRPSIVMPTYREPLVGWTDNIYGIISAAIGVALGVIRSIQMNPDNVADLVPADFVVNQLIAAAWHAGNTAHNGSKDLTVYNYVSSVENPIKWRDFQHIAEKKGELYGSTKIIWHHGLFRTRPNYYWHKICCFCLHTIPAHLIDFVLYIIGQKPIAVAGYKKIEKFIDVLSYFGMRQWEWKNDNVRKLFKEMSPVDRKIFNFDVKSIDWEENVEGAIKGGKLYILKEPMDTLKAGRRRVTIFKYIHYFSVALLAWICYVLLAKIVRMLFGL